jgi:hypothetical protein
MYAAVLARLADQLPATLPVEDGDTFRGSSPQVPYVVAHAGIATRSAPQLSGIRSHRDLEVQIIAVGQTPDQARWAAEAVDTALVGWIPTIAGMVCWPVDQAYSAPPRSDTSVPEHPVQSAALGYTVRARRVG